MNLKPEQLGKNIRKARQERDLTQEVLAELLNVSESAVSQWESGKTSPDLGILPELCSVLDVSSDWLLDIGTEAREKEIEKILDRAKTFSDAGRDNQAAQILKEGLKKYPSSDALVYNLMYVTYNDDEVIDLGEWILKNSTSDRFRHGAIQCLVYAYSSKGDRQKAIELARKMPGIPTTKDALLCHALTGDERMRHVQNYRRRLLDELETELFDGSDKTEEAKRSISLFELLFEKGDFGFFNERLAKDYRILAKNSATIKDKEKTLFYLGKAADHALSFVAFYNDPSFRYSSALFAGLPGERVLCNESDNAAQIQLSSMKDTLFDFVRKTDGFRSIVERLTPVAGPWIVRS